MTLEELIARYRLDADDKVAPYLASDEDVTAWLNESVEEAALRARLIFDATTAEVCSIAVTAGVATYDLHESVFHVARATFTPTGSTDDPIELALTDRIEQDRLRRGWRTLSEEPRYLIVDDTKVQLACLPDTAGTIDLEVYRAPLVQMVSDGDTPEIGRAHHRFLPQWALYRNYSRPDAEVHDPGRAETALAVFTRQFGERPDADLRRSLQSNTPAHNKAYF